MKTKMIPSNKNQKGSIIVIAVVIMVVLSILGVGMLMLGRGARLIAARTTADMSARLAADAGITKAMYKMNDKLLGHLADGTVWDNSSLPTATNESMDNAYSNFSLNVTANGSAMGNGFKVVSTGSSSNQQRVVKAEAFPVSSWKGIAVKDTITIKSGATFDTYPVSGGEIVLRTNTIGEGDIQINNKVNFDASIEIIVGPGGNADEVITGQGEAEVDNSYAAVDSVTLNPVPVPIYLKTDASGGTITEGTLTAANTGKYSEINMGNGSILTVSGTVELYVTGDVTLDNGASIFIEDPGKLVLFINGDLEAKEGSLLINDHNDATYLEIYGTENCQSIVLKASSDFYGVINAPEADIHILNSGDAYGAFVGESFELKNSGNFYYDTRVYDPNTLGYDISFNIDYWWED